MVDMEVDISFNHIHHGGTTASGGTSAVADTPQMPFNDTTRCIRGSPMEEQAAGASGYMSLSFNGVIPPADGEHDADGPVEVAASATDAETPVARMSTGREHLHVTFNDIPEQQLYSSLPDTPTPSDSEAGPFAIRRSSSTISQDNPFIPGGELSLEVDNIMRHSLFTRTKIIIRDHQTSSLESLDPDEQVDTEENSDSDVIDGSDNEEEVESGGDDTIVACDYSALLASSTPVAKNGASRGGRNNSSLSSRDNIPAAAVSTPTSETNGSQAAAKKKFREQNGRKKSDGKGACHRKQKKDSRSNSSSVASYDSKTKLAPTSPSPKKQKQKVSSSAADKHNEAMKGMTVTGNNDHCEKDKRCCIIC